MEGWRKNRRKIPPPTRQGIGVGDLLLRECDKRLCIVLNVEKSAKAVYGMSGEYRANYRLYTAKGNLRVKDTEIIAGYEVLSYALRE